MLSVAVSSHDVIVRSVCLSMVRVVCLHPVLALHKLQHPSPARAARQVGQNKHTGSWGDSGSVFWPTGEANDNLEPASVPGTCAEATPSATSNICGILVII